MRICLASLRSLPPRIQLDLAVGRLSPEVPTDPILHELVHHMCANSIVNVAMQYRWLELMRASLSSPLFFTKNAREMRLMTMATGLAAAEDVLQPIAEGLATFAEFDCALPDVELYQQAGFAAPDAAALRLLSLRGEGSDHIADFARASRREKLTASALDRRIEVLCHPLFPETANDAYLLGYLMIKAIADRVRPDPAIRAAEVLGFLHYYVFEDWGLARLLATPGEIPVHAVLRRLESRLQALLDSDLHDRVLAFKQDTLQRKARGMLPRGPEEMTHGPWAGLGLTKSEVSSGERLLSQFYESAVGPQAPLTGGSSIVGKANPLPQYLLMIAPVPKSREVDLYLERHPRAAGSVIRYLDFVLEVPEIKRPLGTAIDMTVEYEANVAGELRLRPASDSEWVTLPAPAGRKLSSTRGVGRLIGVFMSTAFPWNLYCHLFIGGQLGAMWGWSSDEDEQLRIAGLLTTELQFEQTTELTLVKLGQHLTDELFVLLNTSIMPTVAASIRRLLTSAGWGAVFHGPTRGNFGLRSILGASAAVSSLAKLGLCNAFTDRRSEIEAILSNAGHDLDALIAACDHCESVSGFRFLDHDRERVRSRV